MSLKLLPKRPAKLLRATLDKLFTHLCRQPPEADTELSFEQQLLNIDQEFKRKRNQVRVTVVTQPSIYCLATL